MVEDAARSWGLQARSWHAEGDGGASTFSDDPRASVTYRTYSGSGSDTLDINRVEGLNNVKRYHIEREGKQ